MDISTELLTNVALNAIGFLAAGAFCALVYLSFYRPGRAAARDHRAHPLAAAEMAGADREPVSRKLKYVRLAEDSEERDSDIVPESQGQARYRRNRAEVIRLAREMMKAGEGRERIKDLLPISETELALLGRDNQ
jgi:hypothetical protein